MRKARDSADKIFDVIDEPSMIDVRKSAGEEVIQKGSVSFENVYFNYPSRPDSTVLNGMDFQIPPCSKIALVGHSGCGKSTIANLILRFYDIKSGSITIDGRDIRDYNLKKLR